MKKYQVLLTKAEKNLIEQIRNVKFGKIVIIVTDGVPLYIEKIVKKIKLTFKKDKSGE